MNQVQDRQGPLDDFLGWLSDTDKKPAATLPSDGEPIPAGERHKRLLSTAGALRHQGGSETEIHNALVELNKRCDPPKEDAELRKLARDAAKWEPGEAKRKAAEAAELARLQLVTIAAPALANKEFIDLPALIDGLLTVGLAILAARPKMGKSWLMLAVCWALAAGGRALGKIKVAAVETLYLGLEDSPRRLKKRLLTIGSDPPAGLHILDTTALDRTALKIFSVFLASLEAWLDEHPGCKLVVVDTLARIRPARTKAESDSYQADADFASRLQDLAQRRGICVLVIHHLRKAAAIEDVFDSISGTLGLSGAADVLWLLKRERGQADAVLHITGRDIEDRELALTFDDTTCQWTLAGDAEEFRMSRQRLDIVDLMRRTGQPMSSPEVAECLQRNRSTVRWMMVEMSKSGTIIPYGQNKYKLPTIQTTTNIPTAPTGPTAGETVGVLVSHSGTTNRPKPTTGGDSRGAVGAVGGIGDNDQTNSTGSDLLTWGERATEASLSLKLTDMMDERPDYERDPVFIQLRDTYTRRFCNGVSHAD